MSGSSMIRKVMDKTYSYYSKKNEIIERSRYMRKRLQKLTSTAE